MVRTQLDEDRPEELSVIQSEPDDVQVFSDIAHDVEVWVQGFGIGIAYTENCK